MAKPKVYVETTIISYLAGRSSRDLIVAARQQLTVEWWQTRREQFDLFASPVVVEEAASGDPDAALRRLQFAAELRTLDPCAEVTELADLLISTSSLPKNAILDAFHIAYAAVYDMDYVISWNITHIANAALRVKIEATCRKAGWKIPVICTPEELSA